MRPPCPACGHSGRPVGAVTIQSLVRADLVGALDEFLFCASPACDIAYYTVEGRTIVKAQVSVRIGIKESASPRPICYCFGFTIEDIERELAAGGTDIPETITAKCREGIDRCPENNPRGACCLGDVRRFAKAPPASCCGND